MMDEEKLKSRKDAAFCERDSYLHPLNPRPFMYACKRYNVVVYEFANESARFGAYSADLINVSGEGETVESALEMLKVHAEQSVNDGVFGVFLETSPVDSQRKLLATLESSWREDDVDFQFYTFGAIVLFDEREAPMDLI